MEGCPRLIAISFDPKTSVEIVDLCEKIPSYIASTYQESGSKYVQECEQINRLRQLATSSAADESGIQTLKRYYCQLQLLRNRFPMLPETECAVRFTWEDAFHKEDSTFNDIRFEEACILYNLGAIYSKLGANESRRTHDSIKNACTYFRFAAGCFEKLRDQYTTYTPDFTPDLLTSQVHILLAQAHEAVIEKAFLDQRTPSVNAHVAMQISEYYQMALLNLKKPGINSIISKKHREWCVSLTYKLSYYFALAQYCCGLTAEENKKHGEAVCYFEAAVERLKEAWKNAEKISSDKTNAFKDAHIFTNDVFTGKFKAAKRDNDSVYFERVPAISSMPAVQGAIVAKSQMFDCHDAEICGPDIFQKLVPLDAHLAASEYSEEKAKLLREIVELIENKTRELETFMNCLQLNRVPLNNEYLRLPRELLDCCAMATARPNMSKELVAAMQQLNSQHHEVVDQINDFEESLDALEEIDDSMKSNKEYKDLQLNLKSIRDMMVQANESNIELHRHMATIIDHLKVLHGPLEQLEKTLPSIVELDDEANKPKIARLALLNEKVETMRKQRETLLNEFRRKIQEDDITKLVLMQRQDNHKNLFSEQVKKHEELINIIKQNCIAQDNILQALTEANADVADIRMKISATFETRNRLIQEYINSCKSFEDTLLKANEGIEFYKKQTIKLLKLNDRLSTLKSQQQQSLPSARSSLRRQFPSTIPARPSPLSNRSGQDFPESDFSTNDLPTTTIPDRPRLKDYLAAMKPDTWGSTTSRSSKRPSARRDDNTFAMPGANVNDINNLHIDPTMSSTSLYSTMTNTNPATLSSLTNYNTRSPRLQSPVHVEQTRAPYVPGLSQSPSTVPQQHVPYQQPKVNQTVFGDSYTSVPSQNFNHQPQMDYNLPPLSLCTSMHPQQLYASQSIGQPTATVPQVFHQPQILASVPSPLTSQQQQSIHPHLQQSFPQQPTQIIPQLPQQSFPRLPQQSVPQQSLPQLPQQTVAQLPQQHIQQTSTSSTPQFVYQTSSPQPSFYPPTQQPIYQTLSPQQSFSQPMHSPAPLPQPTYQTPVVQPTANVSGFNQPPFLQQQLPSAIPNQQISQPAVSQQPTIQHSQSFADSNRPTASSTVPPKFDPYRPQPVGAYDIPKLPNATLTSLPSQHQQQQQQQQIVSLPQQQQQINSPILQQQVIPGVIQQQHQAQPLQPQQILSSMQPQQTIQPSQSQLPISSPSLQQQQTVLTTNHINSQDIYRPGGLFTSSQPQNSALSSVNNNSYDQNQATRRISSQSSPSSHIGGPSATNTPTNTVSKPSILPKIADDLLSLAIEQHLDTINESEPKNSESTLTSSVEDDWQMKSNGKPIACIQPLPVMNEEKSSVQSLVVPSTSLQPPKDPYDDKDKLDQLVSDVQRFEKHVSTMTKKTLNGTIPLEVEWKELSDLQEKDVHTQTCAVGKCNQNLNRFHDLIPYDNSRIRLVQTNSNQQKHFNDYINATSIGCIRDASLLIAQYPIPATVGDFWSMIYDQHVAIVAVLLRPDEIQSLNVYPQAVGEELRLSSYTVTLLSMKSANQFTNHKIIRVHNSQVNQSRTVVWLEHYNWPPKEMPDNPVELLKFIQEVQHFLIQTRNRRSTILATCLSGVSRTGPFLALLTSIQDIDEGRSFPDLSKIIRLLRSKRRHLIQDMNQLKFVYEALLYYAQDFLVKRGVLKVGSMMHHQSTTSLKSTSTNISTTILDVEMQRMMDRAKPIVQSTPNYDVGPILSSTPTSTITEDKPPPRQLTAIEENFNLRPEESHIKPKTTKEDFFRTKSTPVKDLSDPFNQLDPLWTLR